jgi:hypothetical protein
MNKILIATALALVASAPLAFAAKTTTPPASFLTTEHCNSVEQTLDRAHYKTESAYRIAQEKAMSLCREDKHKNSGVEFGSRLSNRG